MGGVPWCSCTIHGNHLHCTVPVWPVLPHQLRGRRLLSLAAQFFVSIHPHNEPTISQFIPSCNRPSSIPKKIHYTTLTIRFHKIPPNDSIRFHKIPPNNQYILITYPPFNPIPSPPFLNIPDPHPPAAWRTCALAVPGSSWPL